MSRASDLANVIASGSTDIVAENIATTNLQQGLAKAWTSIDQDTADHPVYDSFNTTSTSDGGTGVTTVTFTNNMNNDSYATGAVGQTDGESAGYAGVTGKTGVGGASKMSTSAYITDNRTTTQAARDLKYSSFIIHGDLA